MQSFEQMQAIGIAAMIPGFQMAIDTLQTELDKLRQQLAALQNPPKKKGKWVPRNVGGYQPKESARDLVNKLNGNHPSGWSDDPAERSREMKRRMAVRHAKNHPRHPDHPDHAKWVETMRKAQKKRFAAMSEADKNNWKQKMKAGKRRHDEERNAA